VIEFAGLLAKVPDSGAESKRGHAWILLTRWREHDPSFDDHVQVRGLTPRSLGNSKDHGSDLETCLSITGVDRVEHV
jgi:hypothetical protein